MLIRTAPHMFSDSNFACVTIRYIREEFFQTQKFKDKYPWRINYKNDIIHIPDSRIDGEVLKAVDFISDEKLSPEGRPYYLSYEDRNIIACAVSNNYKIGTGDNNIIKFAKNEFDIHSSISALGILNSWIRNGLIAWSKELDVILKEWKLQEERRQPGHAKSAFKRLTKKIYPGP